MKLSCWVKSVGGFHEAAKILDIPERTVESWLLFTRTPRPRAAHNIVQKTGGLVDYNGVYGPVSDHIYNDSAVMISRTGV